MGRKNESNDELADRILDTALRLFAEKGQKATTMREIARACGVTLGGVQHHFKTREALEEACMKRVMLSFQDQQSHAFEADDEDIPSLLHAGLPSYIAWARRHPDVVRLGSRLALETPDHSWPGENEMNAELARRFRVAQDKGLLQDFDPRLMLVLMEVCLNAWSGFAEHYHRHFPELSQEETDRIFLEFFVDCVLGGILSPKGRKHFGSPRLNKG